MRPICAKIAIDSTDLSRLIEQSTSKKPVCVSSRFVYLLFFFSKIALTFEDRASCGQTMMILKALELRLLKQV